MASPSPGDPVSDTAIIKAVLPNNTVKRLARLMGAPFETAKHWTYKHLSAARRRELALALLAELDEQDKLRADAREHLQKIVGTDAVDGVLAGEAPGAGRSAGQAAGAMAAAAAADAAGPAGPQAGAVECRVTGTKR